MECLPIPEGVNGSTTPKGVSESTTPEGVSESTTPEGVSESTTSEGVNGSTTLSARFKYLELVLVYSIPHPTSSFRELAEMLEKDFEEASPINPKQDFEEASPINPKQDFEEASPINPKQDSEQTSPKDLVFKALNILDELVEKLDTSTKILLENEYSNSTEEYASCYRDAAWSRSFEDIRKVRDYKEEYNGYIHQILDFLAQEDPEILSMPPAVFLKLCATPMLEISLASRLFLIWKQKRGL